MQIKKTLSEIRAFLNPEKLKNDQRIVVFSICLLIAIGLWFLNAMGKNYITSVYYPVKYINVPKELFLTSKPPSRFELKVEAHGFTLLRQKLSLSVSPVVLDISSIRENHSANGLNINIPSESLVRRISEQVSHEITVMSVSPRILTFTFDSLASRKVPVKANTKTTFKPQFFLKGPISVEPESLEVSGPASVLDTLRFIKTEEIKLDDVSSTIEKDLDVMLPDNTESVQDKVSIRIPVEKFTEKEIRVPIIVKNEPADTRVKLFPSEITVTFWVGLSHYEKIHSDNFKAVVDYKAAEEGDEILDVEIREKPPYIQMIRITPRKVEFLIEPN